MAVIGTVGVPANYGGFETLVDNILGDNTSEGIQYTVYCSSKAYDNQLKSYKGAHLKYLGLNANGVQSTFYDILAMMRTSNKYDVALVLGVSGCIFLPIFRWWFKNRLIVNIDGLEHRRAKWGRFAKWFLKKSEAMAVKYADIVIADNKGIQDYVKETYGIDAVMIAYGGDHALREVSREKTERILQEYGLEPGKYAISVCRIEPENNCHVVLDAFSNTDKKLVYIGNWGRSDYGRLLKDKYSSYKNIMIHEPEYDLEVLYVLRSNAEKYIHGHSAGGTNPSLVEAMFFGNTIIAYDVVYNRATTEDRAFYFKDADELKQLLSSNESNGEVMKQIAVDRYTWRLIAAQYEALY